MITVIGIHGVGSHVKGSVHSMIADALSESEYNTKVDEAYWCDEVDLRSQEDAFLISNAGRLSGSMLSIASDGFLYFTRRGIGVTKTKGIMRLVDSITFIAFHIFFLLIPVAIGLNFYNLWFESQTVGSATFLTYSQIISEYILTCTPVLGILLFLSGIGLQLSPSSKPGLDQIASLVVAIFMSVRRLALYVVNTLLIVIVAPLSSIWIRAVLGFVLIFSTFAALISTPARKTTNLFFSPEVLARAPINDHFWPFLSITGYMLLAVIALILVFTVVYPVVKTLADICLYLGDKEHRVKLLRIVDASVMKQSAYTGNIVLVGHSLGSVVALDYLRTNASKLSGASTVTLITMGSPIARFFHRFFPFNYPKPVDILRDLKKVVPGFLWLNIYRPLDPIGGNLGITENTYGYDRTTNQVFIKKLLQGKIFAQHEGYFEDERIHQITREVLADHLVSRSLNDNVVLPKIQHSVGNQLEDNQSLLRVCAVLAWVIGVAILAWLVFVQLPRSIVGIEKEAIGTFQDRALAVSGRFEVGEIANVWLFGRPIWPDYLAHVVFVPYGTSDEVRVTPLDVNHRAAFFWAAEERVEDHGLVNVAIRPGLEILYDEDDPKSSVVPSFRSGRWTGRNGNLFNRLVLFGALATAWTALVLFQTGFLRPTQKRISVRNTNPFT